MDLRPRRERQYFSGFTNAEVLRMEQLLNEYREESLEEGFCKKLAGVLNRSNGRAGKPAAKWTEIQDWFQKNHDSLLKETSESSSQNKAIANPRRPEEMAGEKDDDFSMLEFEARSSKDKAWYDVDTFLSHRFLSSGEIEVCVRFVGFGSDEDEWVNVKNCVRKRSVALDRSECQKVKVGDLVVCFQERRNQARYYDAHIIEIQKQWHDIRGCRCFFLIRYDHDNTEEKVRLRRLCCRPT